MANWFGTLGDHSATHMKIQTEKISEYAQNPDFQQAAHGLIFARDDRLLWNLFKTKAMVMMQMRFDGVLGFPGGLVDAGENIVDGLNREMAEEIGLNLNKYKFNNSHHLISHFCEKKKLVLHFYTMEVNQETFCSLEQGCLSALEYGIETLGSVRVPLYTMEDGVRGLPAFLANQFAGNAKEQLLLGLLAGKILSKEDVTSALQASPGSASVQKS